jgi:hypothetical protein
MLKSRHEYCRLSVYLNYTFRNSDNSRKELKEDEKKNKKQMDTSIRKYRQTMKKELKTLTSENPKEYWKILNKGQKKKQPNICNDVLCDFKKNLNGAPVKIYLVLIL